MSERILPPAQAYLDMFAQEVFDAAKEHRPLNEDRLKTDFNSLSAADKQTVRNEYFKQFGKHFKY